MIPLGAHTGAHHIRGPYVNPQLSKLADGAHGLDETNGAWDIAITKHNPSLCKPGRYGCMTKRKLITPGGNFFPYNASAANYDSRATMPAPCYFIISACLNKDAQNYGCTKSGGTEKCPFSGEDTPTEHLGALCTWGTPPAFVEPTFSAAVTDAASEVSFAIVCDVIMAGEVSDFDYDKKQTMMEAYNATIGNTQFPLSLEITPASVKASFTVTTVNLADQKSVTSKIANTLSTAAQFQSAIGNSIGVQVLARPQITVVPTVLKDGTKDDLSTGAIVGIVIGVLAGLALALCLVWVFCCGGKEFFAGRLRPPPPPPGSNFDKMGPAY
jgi:hypothetical protein